MRRLALIAALGLVATVPLVSAVAPAPAPATPAPLPAAKPASGSTPMFGSSNLPIDISADNSEQFREERRAVWYGNVEAIQGDSRMRTPRLTVFYAARDPGAPKPATGDPTAGVGQVERIEAEGTVYYVTPTQRAKGDHATYLASNDTITMTGNVVLLQDKNVATGDKLVIEQKTGHSTLTSNARAATGATAPQQRVRSVLYPNQNTTGQNQTGAAPAGAKSPTPPPKSAHP